MQNRIHNIRLAAALAIFSAALMPAPTFADADTMVAPSQDYVAPQMEPTIISGQVPMQPQTQGTVRVLGTLSAADMALPPLPPSQKMGSQQYGQIAYITGGVGDEERAALEAAKNDYNLHVTIADNTGHFLADTNIVIRDSKGEVLLQAVAGPILYARVPAGKYTIEASYGDSQVLKREINLRAGNKPSSVHFSW